MPTAKEIKWGEDNPIEAAPVLSEEERDTLKKRMEAMDKLLHEQKKAKFKIEILFSHDRKPSAAYIGALSFWESGTKLHGGGDAKLYECPGRRLGVNDCVGFIPDPSQGYGFLVCPKCQKVWHGNQVSGEVFARSTTANWAQLIYKYFVRLEHNADIYMKLPRVGLRAMAAREQAKQRGGEDLEKARGSIVRAIYPLANIIKDTSAGADVLVQLRKFLSV